jgi:hypothetical protein
MIEEQAAHGIAWAVGQMLEEEVRLGRLVLGDVGLATRLLLSLLTGAPTKEAGRGGTKLVLWSGGDGSRGRWRCSWMGHGRSCERRYYEVIIRFRNPGRSCCARSVKKNLADDSARRHAERRATLITRLGE